MCEKGIDVHPLSDGYRCHSDTLYETVDQAVTNDEDMEKVAKKLSKRTTKLVKRKKFKTEQPRLI